MMNNKALPLQAPRQLSTRQRLRPVAGAVGFALSGAFWSGNSNAATPLGCPVTSDLDITSDQYIAAPVICNIDLTTTLTVTSTAGASLANYGTLNNAGSLINYNQLTMTGGTNSVGILDNTGSLTNAGNILVTEPADYENLEDRVGNALLSNAGSLVNDGSIVVNSGTLNNSGYLYNAGEIRLEQEPKLSYGVGGRFANTGALVNAGSFYTSSPQTLAGTISNLSGGSIKFGGAYYNYNFRTVLNADVNNAGDFSSNAIRINGDFINSGYMDVGAYRGYVDITGYLHNTASGEIKAEKFYGRTSSLLINDGTFESRPSYGPVDRFAGHVINHGSMTFRGTNSGTIDNDGALFFSGYDNKVSGIINNTGQLSFNGDNDGIINNSGDLSLGSSYAYLDERKSRNRGTIQNSGTLTIGPYTVEINNQSVINNSGTVDIAAGKSITGTGSFTQTDGQTTVNGALVQDSIAFTGGVVSGSGALQATGGDVLFGADASINPGNSPGTLNIFDDATIEGLFLAELQSPVEYDKLLISGTVTLDNATFAIELLDNYAPDFQDAFDVMSAQTINGQFSSLLLPELQNSLTWNVQYLLSDTGMDIMRVTAVPIPGAVWLFGTALGLLGWRYKVRA